MKNTPRIKRLKEIIGATLVAGSLAFSAGCIAVPPQGAALPPRIIYEPVIVQEPLIFVPGYRVQTWYFNGLWAERGYSDIHMHPRCYNPGFRNHPNFRGPEHHNFNGPRHR